MQTLIYNCIVFQHFMRLKCSPNQMRLRSLITIERVISNLIPIRKPLSDTTYQFGFIIRYQFIKHLNNSQEHIMETVAYSRARTLFINSVVQ